MTSQTSALPHVLRGEANPALTSSLAILVVAAATIAGAWFFQLVLDVLPCPMCLEQRYAYYFAIPFAALIAVAAAKGAPRNVVLAGLAILALVVLGNAVFGAYHAGVEWGFWKGPTDCTGSGFDPGKAGSLLDNLDKVKVIRCDEVQFRFLGISLAGYNALISLAMAGCAGFGLLSAKK